MKGVKKYQISVPTVYDDAYLSFIEGRHNVPFAIKRVYFIHSCLPKLDRGHHAHKRTHQALFCIRGNMDIMLNDGRKKVTIHLKCPNKGVDIPPRVWHEMKHMSSDCLILVIASEYYRESDYIRDYGSYKTYIAKHI